MLRMTVRWCVAVGCLSVMAACGALLPDARCSKDEDCTDGRRCVAGYCSDVGGGSSGDPGTSSSAGAGASSGGTSSRPNASSSSVTSGASSSVTSGASSGVTTTSSSTTTSSGMTTASSEGPGASSGGASSSSGASSSGGGGQSSSQGPLGAPLGSMCNQGTECQSGRCTDGVCCDSSCTGTCQSCLQTNTGLPDGQCRATLSGTDPDDDCADEGAASCGTTGLCDGTGACERYGMGTICQGASCDGTTLHPADTCDGQGNCVDRGTMSCGAYACSNGACLSSCTNTTECGPGSWCENGMCAAQRQNGNACGGDAECLSGFCADGVCCNTACTGSCEACTGALKGSGFDGTCGFITADRDPDNECNGQAASTCGTSGLCDGAGSCAFHSQGTECAAASCSGATATRADTCDGAGTCVDRGTQDCGLFLCQGGACPSSCSVVTHCVATAYCNNGNCAARKNNGSTCGGNVECSSGFCVDGVCCDSACTGTCRACTAAKKGSGSNGTCGSIMLGADPDNECSASAQSTCGLNGTCDGAGACDRWASGTTCVAASCSGSVLTEADTCNGNGTCVDQGTQNCSPYLCSNGACATSCTATGCVSGYYCDGNGACQPLKQQGAACTASNQCQTGFCVDGVCCESACTGTCRSCSGQWNSDYTDGVCGTIEAGDPDNECPAICCYGICRTFQQCQLQ